MKEEKKTGKAEKAEKPALAKKDYSVHETLQGVHYHWFLKKGDEVSEENMPSRYWDLLRRENVI